MLGKLENWSGISIGAISMGQEVGVTPIQLVTAVSAIANGGYLRKPYIISEVRKGDQVASSNDTLQPEPRMVIRPETAATLRRMMEGVILDGTGRFARLDGWTAGGKTGTAQKIDPSTGRYSRTKVIASFTGFAPINNPAVTILVSVDSPEGWPHDGAAVSAPVFKRIAEQVLAYMDVPRDVPLNPRLVQTTYRQNRESEAVAMEDDTPMDFSAPAEMREEVAKTPEAAPVQQPAQAPNVAVTMDEGGDIQVPDFKGKTMREVADTCMRLGLNPVLVGSSLAVHQMPAAGSKVRRGAKIRVEFGTPPVHAGKVH